MVIIDTENTYLEAIERAAEGQRIALNMLNKRQITTESAMALFKKAAETPPHLRQHPPSSNQKEFTPRR